MADGRFLSKSIAHDVELNTVSLEADYLFTRCIPHLDVEGRMVGHPAQVKSIACPMRDAVTVTMVERALEELDRADLIQRYWVEGRPYILFPGFRRNQKGLRTNREAPSRIPAPDLLRTCSGPTPEPSGANPPQVGPVGGEQLRSNSGATPEDSGLTPPEVEVEVEVEEQIGPAADVEKSPRNVYKSAEEDLLTPPDSPPSQVLTISEVAELADRVLGLGMLPVDERQRNRRLVTTWDGQGRDLAEIATTIEGLAAMVRDQRPEVRDWLPPGKPIGLRALQNTNTLYDQGDGKAQRPLWDVAFEYGQRQAIPVPRGRRGGGLKSIDLQLAT